MINVMVLYYIIFISLFFVPMSNQPKVKSPPKVVSISLQSPQKKKKEPSPPVSKDPFNSPLSSLKKTFNTSKNTYSHIQANHQQKIFEHEQQKKQEKYLREQQIADQQNHPKLTEKQLRTCRKLFQILDRDNKGYIVYEDLRQMGKTDTQIVGIVRKVFVRKEQNSFFDFVYGLWDTESLGRLVGCVEGE